MSMALEQLSPPGNNKNIQTDNENNFIAIFFTLLLCACMRPAKNY
jgi:hypothetical protein